MIPFFCCKKASQTYTFFSASVREKETRLTAKKSLHKTKKKRKERERTGESTGTSDEAVDDTKKN
jgi:hypothetical protein